jgi:DNA-directed RNA polymerase subunit omega
MARVTVEDCVLQVPNRFDLVLLAGQRARDVSSGEEELVPRDNDKNPVIALREISERKIDLEAMKEKLVLGLQKQQPADELEDDAEAVDSLTEEAALLAASAAAANEVPVRNRGDDADEDEEGESTAGDVASDDDAD